MIDSTKFDAIKRTLALRLLTKMPDEALGELLHAMHEIIEHYGSLDAESFESTMSRRGIVSLRQMQNLLQQIDMPDMLHEPPDHDPEETQEAEQILPVMQEAEVEDTELEYETRPVNRPPAIATREAFQAWLEAQA